MSPGSVAYIVCCLVAYIQALRAMRRYSRGLRARGREGLFMDDPAARRRALDNPLAAFRLFTKSSEAMRGPLQGDPELEPARLSALRWAAIAFIVTFAGLPLV